MDDFLDLGCGTGQMIARVGKRFRPSNVVAVDHSQEMLTQARANTRDLDLNNIEFVQSDLIRFLQDTDAKFSLISCVGVLHHLLLEDVDAVLASCRNRLKKDGYLLVAEPEITKRLTNPSRSLAWWNSRSVFRGRSYRKFAVDPDEHPLQQGQLSRLLLQSGYRLVAESRGVEAFPWNDPPSLLDRLVIRLVQASCKKDGFVVAALAKPQELPVGK